jgi:hypothetical protein
VTAGALGAGEVNVLNDISRQSLQDMPSSLYIQYRS